MMPTLLAIEALEADQRYLERQLASTPDGPWGTERLMWQSRLEAVTVQIEELAASSSVFASIAVIFDGGPVIGAGDISVDFTTRALDSYQKLVALTLAVRSGMEMGERGPSPRSDQARLFIRDLVRGSMGFILEEVPDGQGALFPSDLKEAVEETTHVIAAFNADVEQDFETILQDAQPRVVSGVQKFAKVLAEANASARLVGDREKVTLTVEDVNRLVTRLSEVEIVEEVVLVRAVLNGILPEGRKFELRLPDGDHSRMEGTVTEELAQKYLEDAEFKERHLLKPVVAHVRMIRTMRNGRMVKERRVLEAIEAV